jgi:hypothetical protein
MTEPRQGDELTRRYHEASAQDTRRPGAHVRDAVRAHAQTVLDAKATARAATPQAPAANQSRWKLSLLASLALVGLTSLLVLQFERGTPEEKELVAGRGAAPAALPESSAVPATPAPSTPSASPLASAKPADSETTATAAPPPANPPVPRPVAPGARARTEAATGSADQTVRPAESALPAPAAPAPRPDPKPAAQAGSPSGMADQASVADEPAPSLQGSTAPAAPAAALRSAPAVTPSPATRGLMPATPNAQEERASRTQRDHAKAGLAKTRERAAQESLHEAARTGQLAQVERLIAQGTRINAPDEADKTPLMLAAIHGHAAVVQRLLAAGANPALVDREGVDALGYARRLGRTEIARMIEAGS